MNTAVQAWFSVQGWDENTWEGKPQQEVSGAKNTQANVKYSYSGEISGESVVRYLMCYVEEGEHGSFVALEHFTGSIGGKQGTFTFQHTGTFEKDGVKATLVIVPGSGTGELAGLRGTGSVDLTGHQERYPLHLDYAFAG